MTRLLIVTRPELAAGFQLAGVEAFGPDSIEHAQELIQSWWEAGEAGLLAIDDGLLAMMEPAFLQRLRAYDPMPFLAIPGGTPVGPEATRKYQVAEMVRRAIGIHITFKGEEQEGEGQ